MSPSGNVIGHSRVLARPANFVTGLPGFALATDEGGGANVLVETVFGGSGALIAVLSLVPAFGVLLVLLSGLTLVTLSVDGQEPEFTVAATFFGIGAALVLAVGALWGGFVVEAPA